MEYFKVKDKAVGGEIYYIAFTSNNTSMNMTGKADIAKTVWHCDADKEPFYTIEIDHGSPFDLNIVDIEYELEPEDWDLINAMCGLDTKMVTNFHDFDPLIDKSIGMYGYLFPVNFLKNKINEVMQEDTDIEEIDNEAN